MLHVSAVSHMDTYILTQATSSVFMFTIKQA